MACGSVWARLRTHWTCTSSRRVARLLVTDRSADAGAVMTSICRGDHRRRSRLSEAATMPRMMQAARAVGLIDPQQLAIGLRPVTTASVAHPVDMGAPLMPAV